jgi:hypothetical protein
VSSTTDGTGDEHEFTMSVDLAVLESLGINLYSNAAAVLSELVANAYDADANKVSITWKPDVVIVADDGRGMDKIQINKRFLKAGYKKREVEGTTSPIFTRKFMGRKGIGKLSVFSIAEVVEVFSMIEGGSSLGLRIDLRDLQSSIKAGTAYHPVPIDVPAEHQRRGTVLVLSRLKSKRAAITAAALRKRLARRFDVMDERTPEAGGFCIEVDGQRLTWADRQELKKLEFIWEFGASRLPDTALPSDVTRFVVDGAVHAGNDWAIRGWFGTAKRPTDLTEDEEAGSLKNIIVLARGRPIQEGILEKLDFSRIFGSYVTGQIEADFLDLDDPNYDDIATSDRQRLIEDDDRVVALRDFLREAFVRAADQWSALRPKKEAKDALEKFPRLREWVDARPTDQRDHAETMIGTIASLTLERKQEKDRFDLFRSGVLAFERIGLRKVSRDLEALGEVQAEQLLDLLGRQDDYETGLWADILRSRVDAISQMRNLADANEKEKVLQKHVWQHLWLLDPAWERATTDAMMEEDLRRLHPEFRPLDKNGKPIEGRIDIRYVNNSGRHVIVELKRYRRKVDVEELVEQGRKYYKALKSVLTQQQQDRPDDIEVVFVLGGKPSAKNDVKGDAERFISDRLGEINARYVLYDALIRNAQVQYEEYLKASDRVRSLEQLLGTLREVDGGDAAAEDGAGLDASTP